VELVDRRFPLLDSEEMRSKPVTVHEVGCNPKKVHGTDYGLGGDLLREDKTSHGRDRRASSTPFPPGGKVDTISTVFSTSIIADEVLWLFPSVPHAQEVRLHLLDSVSQSHKRQAWSVPI